VAIRSPISSAARLAMRSFGNRRVNVRWQILIIDEAAGVTHLPVESHARGIDKALAPPPPALAP